MKKISKYAVTLVFAFSVLFPAVSLADTASDLQARINSLLVLIQQLQAQLAQMQGGSGSTAFCHTFNTDLGIGSGVGESSKEVHALVTALDKNGLNVGALDVSSYDETTASAVSQFQEKYKGEILTPAGLSSPTGYLGGRTRTKLNQLYGCGNNSTTSNSNSSTSSTGSANLPVSNPVESSIYDLTHDGIVDNNDLTLLQQVVGGLIVCPSGVNCDVNGNGSLTTTDLVAMRNYIINLYDFNNDGVLSDLDSNVLTSVVGGIMACPANKNCDIDHSGSLTTTDSVRMNRIVTALNGNSSQTTPTLSVVSALTGASSIRAGNDVAKISWSGLNSGNISLYYEGTAGQMTSLITTMPVSYGSYNWTVPSGFSGQWRIRGVLDQFIQGGSGITFYSPTFTVVPSTKTQSVSYDITDTTTNTTLANSGGININPTAIGTAKLGDSFRLTINGPGGLPNNTSVYLCIDQKPSGATDVSIGCSYSGNTGTSGLWTQNNSWPSTNTNWIGTWTEHAEVRDGVNTYKSPAVSFNLSAPTQTSITLIPQIAPSTLHPSDTAWITISWGPGSMTNFPINGNVSVYYEGTSGQMSTFIRSFSNPGDNTTFSWIVPTGISGDWRIKVVSDKNGTFYSTPFTVTSPTITSSVASLSATPSSLSFNYIMGSSAMPSGQFVTISPDSSSSSWTATANFVGLNLNYNGNLGTTVSGNGFATIAVNISGPFNVGTFNGNIVITYNGLTKTIPVTLIVTAPVSTTPTTPPVFSAGSSAYTTGISPIYTVTNLSANQSATVTFYSFGPASRGCTSGCSQTATTNSSGVATFTGSGFTSSDVGSWTSYVIYNGLTSNTISYSVTSPATTQYPAALSASPASLTFNALLGQAPSSQAITVSTNNFTVSASNSWIQASTNGNTVTISISPSFTAYGIYRGTVTISNSSANQAIPITVYITSSLIDGSTSTSGTTAVTSGSTTVTPTASFSIYAHHPGSSFPIYSGFQIGDTFTIQLTSNQPNKNVYLCSDHGTTCVSIGSPTIDASGNWSYSGTWTDTGAIGTWTEWMQIKDTSGALIKESNHTTFTLSAQTASASNLSNYDQMANALNAVTAILQQMLKSLGY